MLKFTITIYMVLIALSSVGCPKPNKPKSRQIQTLDDSQFPKGAKIGFDCQKYQPPMSRSGQQKKAVILTSTSIIKTVTILVTGEMTFHLKCKRDVTIDKGDVVAPSVIEKDLKAEGIIDPSSLQSGPSDPPEKSIGEEPIGPLAPIDPNSAPSSPVQEEPAPYAGPDPYPGGVEPGPFDGGDSSFQEVEETLFLDKSGTSMAEISDPAMPQPGEVPYKDEVDASPPQAPPPSEVEISAPQVPSAPLPDEIQSPIMRSTSKNRKGG